MDDLTASNQRKWDELVRLGVLYSRPLLDLTPQTAREWLDPQGLMGPVEGKEVLCLASGGGKQTAAFGVLGARVHVLDFSQAMLQRDRETADHYGYLIDIQHGDMRDLSRFAAGSFDLVYQPYSINYIPNPPPVFREVNRVLKPGGLYHLQIHNPFFIGMLETEWTGTGYPIKLPYLNGAPIEDMPWEFEDSQGQVVKMDGPREFRHTLSAVLNDLSGLGFVLLALFEETGWDPNPTPGTWDHFMRTAPPWLSLWFAFRPDVMPQLPHSKEI